MWACPVYRWDHWDPRWWSPFGQPPLSVWGPWSEPATSGGVGVGTGSSAHSPFRIKPTSKLAFTWRWDTDVLGLLVEGTVTPGPLLGSDCLVPSAPHSEGVPSSGREPFFRHRNLAPMVAARTAVFLSHAYHGPGTLQTAPHLHQLYDFWMNSLASFLLCVLICTTRISSRAGFMWGIGRFRERVGAHEAQNRLCHAPSSDPDRCWCACSLCLITIGCRHDG